MAKIDTTKSKGDFIRLIQEEKVLEIDRFTDVLFSAYNLESQEILDQVYVNFKTLIQKVEGHEKKIISKINRDMSIETWLSESNSSFIPKRFQVILFCFLLQADYKKTNELLTACGYHRLNARSIVDATLIYALKMNLSFDQWAKLFQHADDHYMRLNGHETRPKSPLTLSLLRAYVQSQKIEKGGVLVTFSPTETLNQEVLKLGSTDDFMRFITLNIQYMSDYRVKGRLRMVEALIQYVDQKILEFVAAFNQYKTSLSTKDLHLLLTLYESRIFKGQLSNGVYIADLMDKNFANKIRLEPALFETIKIQVSSICDDYSNFYHQVNLLNEDKKEKREINIKAIKEKTKVEYDDSKEGVSQNLTNRYAVEDFENMILGQADPNRKFLISFLIFTGLSEIEVINSKLLSCGFDALNTDRMSDRFFQEFLASENKFEFLYDVVEVFENKHQPFLLEGFSDALTSDLKEIRKTLKL